MYIDSSKTGRTMRELISWAQRNNMTGDKLRNCLAWLSMHRHAFTRYDSKDNAIWHC